MFSYVAKTLLSKTLRTFLRTYLDDIELEGINWSSTVDNNTNNAAGWGVQLSNVKLREGMELMTLPGKRKRTVIVAKKVKKTRRNERGNTYSPSPSGGAEVEETPRTSNVRQIIDLGRKDEPFQAELPFHQPQQQQQQSKNIIASPLTNNQDIIIPTLDEAAIMQNSLHRERALSEDYSDSGYRSSAPPTPKQYGFCGISCSNNNGTKSHKISNCSSADPSASFDDNFQKIDGSSIRSVSFDDSSIENNKSKIERDYFVPPPPPLPDSESHTDNVSDVSLGDDDDQSLYIEIEEECIIEDDMALVVGSGGVIGALNIRVVDKELHITVEDAHLILEVMPKEDVSDKGNMVPSPNNKAAAKKPATVESSASSYNSTKADLKKNDEDKDTIGETIKKKSTIAKILSMIPMLFLRDCRVTLILPEEVDPSRGAGDDESTHDSIDNCTVFELGIDFLSVSSGDDFMDVFFKQNTAENASPPLQPHRRGSNSSASPENSTVHSEHGTIRPGKDSNYVYERRRLRTGKGPEGGIWLKIYRPKSSDIVYGRKKRSNYTPLDKQKWARQRFLDSSQAFCLRCSGIDLHARYVIEKRREVDKEIKSILSDEFEDYTIDSMLFGVDYIDPATITRHANRQRMFVEQINTPASNNLAVSASNIDSNGIESISLPSNFHWIAQRCHRIGCSTSHVPLEECAWCWNTCIEKPLSSSTKMDSFMPLPGSVFSLSIIDPIEMSVDRNHLDAFGYLLSLFTANTMSDRNDDNINQVKQNKVTKREEGGQSRRDSTIGESFDNNAFPSYMQPDAIHISDIYVRNFTMRFHALLPRPGNDFGLRFGFWELNATSICCEDQQVDSDELKFRDMTFHIGSLKCIEYKGTCERNIVTLGPVSALPSKLTLNDVYIPSTASQILELHSPPAFFDVGMDSSYAVHAKLIHREGPKDEKCNGFVSLKTGSFDIDLGDFFIEGLKAAANEANLIIVGERQSEATERSEKNSTASKSKDDSIWLLQVATKGGNLSYHPRVKVKLPASSYQAKKCSDGFSLNTFLTGLGVEYGKSLFKSPTPQSLSLLSVLPESLRLHVLLYLDDLAPLEKALKIKKKKNTSAFLRSHTVSKKLSKLQPSSNQRTSIEEETHRRNDLLSRLQSLDVDSLEALLAIHDSFPKKTEG